MRYARKAIRYGITCYWLYEPRMVVFHFPSGKRVKKNMRVNNIWAYRLYIEYRPSTSLQFNGMGMSRLLEKRHLLQKPIIAKRLQFTLSFHK